MGSISGRAGGWVAGKADIITNSAQLGLELRLSLAKENIIQHIGREVTAL